MVSFNCLYILLLSLIRSVYSDVLCESGFCRTYSFDVGCTSPNPVCNINNATHSGIWLPSPTTCNCCDYCLPLYGVNELCSVGGPGVGTTVGRCSSGLTCAAQANGDQRCERMSSECHSAQDHYETRHANGETGALERRPGCDEKAQYAAFDCVPTQTCFCQSESGERLFGEVLNLGITTERNMHCHCSRFHEKIKRSISPGVPFPVMGPRCTADGNFNPVQCRNRTCYCVNRITGLATNRATVNLDEEPLSELDCYDPSLDLFPNNVGKAPFNYTTPCFDSITKRIKLILQSEEEGYNVDFASRPNECLPDGTYGRIETTVNGTKICIDDHGQQIGHYKALPNTTEFDTIDCKCAQTTLLMASSNELPVCCKDGNFRKVQCRRGFCHCVDSDGRQIEKESEDVTTLSCYTQDWRHC